MTPAALVSVSLACGRELTLTPESRAGMEWYRLALVHHDNGDARQEGGFCLIRSEMVELLRALDRLTSNVDDMGLPGE